MAAFVRQTAAVIATSIAVEAQEKEGLLPKSGEVRLRIASSAAGSTEPNSRGSRGGSFLAPRSGSFPEDESSLLSRVPFVGKCLVEGSVAAFVLLNLIVMACLPCRSRPAPSPGPSCDPSPDTSLGFGLSPNPSPISLTLASLPLPPPLPLPLPTCAAGRASGSSRPP